MSVWCFTKMIFKFGYQSIIIHVSPFDAIKDINVINTRYLGGKQSKV